MSFFPMMRGKMRWIVKLEKNGENHCNKVVWMQLKGAESIKVTWKGFHYICLSLESWLGRLLNQATTRETCAESPAESQVDGGKPNALNHPITQIRS